MKSGRWGILILTSSLSLCISAYALNHHQSRPGYISRFPVYPSPLDERVAIMSAPPGNDFVFEVRKLADAAAGAFIPVEGKTFISREFVARDDTARQNFEKTVLISTQLANLETARAAEGADAAYEVGKELPPIVRSYTAGAVAFKHNDLPAALSRFNGISQLDIQRLPISG